MFLRSCNQLNQAYPDYLEQSPVLKIKCSGLLITPTNYPYDNIYLKVCLRQDHDLPNCISGSRGCWFSPVMKPCLEQLLEFDSSFEQVYKKVCHPQRSKSICSLQRSSRWAVLGCGRNHHSWILQVLDHGTNSLQSLQKCSIALLFVKVETIPVAPM